MRWPIYREDRLSELILSIKHTEFDYGGLSASVQDYFSDEYNCKHSFLVNSGRAGLEAIISAMELSYLIRYKRVVISPLTFPGCVSLLHRRGYECVIAGCHPLNGNILPSSVPTKRVDFVLATHLWGVPCFMDELMSIGLPIVEDFSHAHFSKYKGQNVGTIGIAGFCSTQRKKLISTGEGGIVITNNDELASFMPEIISPGSTSPSDMAGYGYNMRMSPFSICALQEQLENRNHLFSVRNEMVKSFEKEVVSKGGTVPLVPPNCKVNWYGYKPSFDLGLSMTFNYEPFSYEVANELSYWYRKGVSSWKSFSLESDLSGLHQFLINRMSVKW